MTSLNAKQSGFTIVELLIVIIVIGILAGLVLVTFTGIQQKARDSERKTDINADASQLEAYFAQNQQQYPTNANMNDTTWVSGNLKGLDKEALRDPSAAAGDYSLATTATAKKYAYAATASDGTTACDNSATPCAKFTLTATLESGGTYVKNSLN